MAKRGENATKMNMFNMGREKTVAAQKEETAENITQNEPTKPNESAEEKRSVKKETGKSIEKPKKSAPVTPTIDTLFPKKKEKGAPVSIYLETDVKKFLDECTDKFGRSRSELVNEIIRSYMH